MSRPEVIEKDPITMAELKGQLKNIEKRDEELSFRGNKTMDYLNEFVDLSDKKAKEFGDKLRELDIARLKEEFIHKIIDGLPRSVEELKVLLQGYTLSLSSEEMQKVMGVVKEYLPKKK